MVKTSVNVFELPQRLGILQYVEYDPSPRECAYDGCLYEGVLIAEGCRKGVCIRYRVKVRSKDRKTWETREFRRVRIGDRGGCIPPAAADALWELATRYDIGVWYEYQYSTCSPLSINCYRILETRKCGIVINGVKLPMPYCNSVKECIELILEDYKREVERLRKPPKLPSRNADELLRKYPELEAFGAEWVRAWAPHARERLVEIAEVMRKYPWMVGTVKKRPPDNLNPYTVEVYVAKDRSVTCISLGQVAYCTQNGVVKAVKLGLEFSQYEVYEGRRCAVYRPKGLLPFTAVGREYVKIL
jgi:hypothetical protein